MLSPYLEAVPYLLVVKGPTVQVPISRLGISSRTQRGGKSTSLLPL
jgi:hypothetical protein